MSESSGNKQFVQLCLYLYEGLEVVSGNVLQ